MKESSIEKLRALEVKREILTKLAEDIDSDTDIDYVSEFLQTLEKLNQSINLLIIKAVGE